MRRGGAGGAGQSPDDTVTQRTSVHRTALDYMRLQPKLTLGNQKGVRTLFPKRKNRGSPPVFPDRGRKALRGTVGGRKKAPKPFLPPATYHPAPHAAVALASPGTGTPACAGDAEAASVSAQAGVPVLRLSGNHPRRSRVGPSESGGEKEPTVKTALTVATRTPVACHCARAPRAASARARHGLPKGMPWHARTTRSETAATNHPRPTPSSAPLGVHVRSLLFHLAPGWLQLPLFHHRGTETRS